MQNRVSRLRVSYTDTHLFVDILQTMHTFDNGREGDDNFVSCLYNPSLQMQSAARISCMQRDKFSSTMISVF